MLGPFIRQVVRLFQPAEVHLWIYTGSTGAPWLFVRWRGETEPRTVSLDALPFPEADFPRAYSVLQDLPDDSRERHLLRALSGGADAAMGAPLHLPPGAPGYLLLLDRRSREWPDDAAALLRDLSALLAAAVSTHLPEPISTAPSGSGAAAEASELVDNLDAVVWEADPVTFAFTYVSAGAEAILGYPREQWLAEPDFWAGHVHPDDLEEAKRICQMATVRGDDHRMQYRMLASDGREVWLRDHVRITAATSGGGIRLTGVMVDVTELVQAQAEKLRKRQILENISEAVCLLDADGRISYVNPPFSQITGYSRSELLGMIGLELVFPEDRQLIQTKFAERAAGQSERYELRLRHKSGAEVWAQQSGRPLLDTRGEFAGVVAVLVDITESRQEQQRQQRISGGLRAMLRAVDQLIASRDADELCRRAVALAHAELGVERCAIMLRGAADEGRGTYGINRHRQIVDLRDFSERGSIWTDQLRRILTSGEPWVRDQKERLDWEGGKPVSLGRGWIVTTPIRSSERILGVFYNDAALSNAELDPALQEVVAVYCSLLGNILERKAATQSNEARERRFRALTEHGSDLVLVADAAGVIQYASASSQRILGFGMEELVGDTLYDLVQPDDRRLAEAAIWKVLREGGTGPAVEVRCRHKDGTLRVLEGVTTNLLNDPNVGGLIINARDITERVEAEAALRHVSQSAPCILWTADVVRQDGEFDWRSTRVINEATAQRILPLDLQPGQSYASAWYACKPEEDRKRMAEVSNTALEADRAGYSNSFRCVRSDGEVRWLCEDARIQPLGPDSWRVTGVCTDITEQKQAEERLRASNEALNTLIQSSPLPIVTLDLEGKVTLWNQAAEQITGQSAGEAMGRFVPAVVGSDPEGFRDMLRSVTTGENVVGVERHWRKRNGEMVYASISMAPLRDAGGAVSGVMLVAADITERKEAAEGLRYIASSAGSLLWHAEVTDPGNGPLNWDLRMSDEEAARRLLPVEQLPGESYVEAWYRCRIPEDKLRTDQYGSAQMRASRSYTQEYRCRRRDGEIRWLSETVQVEALGPHRWRAVGVTTDVTERRQAEEALREAQEQLLQAQKMEAVGRLAGGVAHDFNNMLAVILGYTELLSGTMPPGTPVRNGLEEIRRAAERAAGLTRQLLAFSRKQVLELRVLDLNEIVLGIDKMLRRLIGEDVELTTIPDAPWGRVKADPGQVDQVILNLAVNARDAMPHGGKLTIQTQNVTISQADRPAGVDLPEGEYVLLTVADTGVGMDPQTVQRIFEPFFTTKEKGKGTGLGLSTVYGVVQQSGGAVRVRSEVGRGTRFDVYLPVADGEARPRAGGATPLASSGRETVLLVEDEAMVRSLVRNVLQLHGYTVLEARDAEDALRLSAEHAGLIDLLLTDVVMPGVSGRELAERLAPRRPEMRVLFMSGYTDDAVVRHGVFAAGQGFIQKPFSSTALAERVRKLLDGAPNVE